MTLMQMQAATSTTSSATSEYVPTGTDSAEYLQHQELMHPFNHAGLGDEIYDDDLADAGFNRRE